MKTYLLLSTSALLLLNAQPASAQIAWHRSAQSGPWSKADTWEDGVIPGAKAKVQIREGHTVTYDLASSPLIRFIHLAGTLTFARDRDTCLDVCLIKIEPGHTATENGADCDAHFME